MQLVLHLGAHGTDEGLIARWLGRNAAGFAQQGVLTPDPRHFLDLLSRSVATEARRDPREREVALLRALGALPTRRWLAVSAPGLLGRASDVLSPEGFYVRGVAQRAEALQGLFPQSTITLMLALRAPSAIIPALLPVQAEALHAALSQAAAVLDGESCGWNDLLDRLRQRIPSARLVVWRHEDLPRLWPQVLAPLVGPGRVLPQGGLIDFASLGLSIEAGQRMRRYLDANPPKTAGQLRQTAEIFARRYGTAPCAPPPAHLPKRVQRDLTRLDDAYTREWASICARDDLVALQP